MEMVKEYISRSVEDTRYFGALIAGSATPGLVLGLVGGLGAGKTEFVRGFMASLDPAAEVRSPTFTLVNCYETPSFPVYHFDFYRLEKSGDLDEIGFGEYLAGNGICLIEWADRFPDVLPSDISMITFRDAPDSVRVITFSSNGLKSSD